MSAAPNSENFFLNVEGSFYFDYSGYAQYRLEMADVKIEYISDIDTYSNHDYFSYRRNMETENQQSYMSHSISVIEL